MDMETKPAWQHGIPFEGEHLVQIATHAENCQDKTVGLPW